MPFGISLGNLLPFAGDLIGSVIGARSIDNARDDQRDIAQDNMAAQARENELNRQFAERILQQSVPNLSSQELGGLIYNAGANQRQQTNDRQLFSASRQFSRAGMPDSSQELMARVIANQGAQDQDFRADSTLKGILGVLPGQGAQSIAASLQPRSAPMNTFNPAGIMGGVDPLAFTIAGAGREFGRLFRNNEEDRTVGDQRVNN